MEKETAMTLSPAAQAVLDAFLNTPGEQPMPGWNYGRDLAAALKAVADQVVPKTPPLKFASHYLEGIWDGRDEVRDDLLRIAAELESQ